MRQHLDVSRLSQSQRPAAAPGASQRGNNDSRDHFGQGLNCPPQRSVIARTSALQCPPGCSRSTWGLQIYVMISLSRRQTPRFLSADRASLGPDPACGTCRKKCRKCDRKRPICDRCRTKGLHCEGYPPRFQFCEMVTVSERGSSSSRPRRGSNPQSLSRSLPVSNESPSGVALTEVLMTASVQTPSHEISFSPDEFGLDATGLSLSSPPSPISPSPPLASPPQAPTTPLTGSPDLDHDLLTNQTLIIHCELPLSYIISA